MYSIVERNDLKPTLLKGIEGTEESLKQIGQPSKASPRVLHISTHGYFFPDPKFSSDEEAKGQPVFKISDQPMLRSGLIFAGGNQNWMNHIPHHEKEDGILTALEISHLDLSTTELVVLSACETGLGEIQGNEGVYGLQRAFKLAGVKNIIMSLWQVPDRQTSKLMQLFYRKWLEENLSIRKAFNQAQLEMWELGFDPYDWAGFVLVE